MTRRPFSHILAAGLLVLSASSYFAFYAQIIPSFRVNHGPTAILAVTAVALLILPLLWLRPVERWAGILAGADEPDAWAASPAHPGSRAWFWFGFAFMAAMFVLLEVRQPFYFTQDDNMVQFLPVIVQGCRSAFHGVFPNWDAYQNMGSPTAALGVYALTYPVTYLCYWIARDVLRNEFLTIEVFSVFHLLLGYCATYWAARCCRIRPGLAVLAGATPVLSGFALIASRSWYYMSPSFLYVPLLVVSLMRLQQGRPGWKWIAATAALIAIYFHSGNVQMWVYGMLFFCGVAGVLVVAEAVPWKHVPAIAAAVLGGVALSAPLLLVQGELTRGVLRAMPKFAGYLSPPHYLPFLVPGAWFYMPTPLDWTGADFIRGAEMVYVGALVCVAALLALGTWYAYRWNRGIGRRNVWLLCALIAFVAAHGRLAPIWLVMLETPGFNKFRLAFKFLVFFNIFVALAGALVMERVVRHLNSARAWERIFVFSTLAVLVAHCCNVGNSFYPYGFRPYPKFDARVESLLRPVTGNPPRIAVVSPLRSVDREYWRSLPHNLPSVYQVQSLAGYDPLVQLDPIVRKRDGMVKASPLPMLKIFGVRYVVLTKRRKFSDDPGAYPLEHEMVRPKSLAMAVPQLGSPVYEDEDVAIYDVPGAAPLAFSEAAPDVALPFKWDASGAEVDTSSLSQGGRVVVNLLWRPQYEFRAGSVRLHSNADQYGRMVIDVPAGAPRIDARYSPPWRKGIALGFVLLAMAAGLTIAYERHASAAQQYVSQAASSARF